MKKIKIYSISFIIVLYLSFVLNGTDIKNNKKDYRDKKDVNPSLGTSSSLIYEWNRTWGGTGHDYGYETMVDPSGNVYVAGYSWSFGEGRTDMVMVKYNENGIQQWNRTWGGSGNDIAYGGAIDALGNVYLAGFTNSFGAGMVLVKYNGNGEQQWNRTWGGGRAHGATVDSLGNVYLVGEISTGGGDIVLVKYNQYGVQQWNRTWGGSNLDLALNVAVDMLDKVYLVGHTASFGAGGSDLVLVKYDENGVEQWYRTWGGTVGDYGHGVAVDASNNVYVAGSSHSFDRFGTGLSDMVLVKYDENGVQQWNRTWGGEGIETNGEVAIDLSGNIYLAGITGYFGAGADDMVLVQYNGNGMQQWNRTWGGTDFDVCYGLTTGSSGCVYLAGMTLSFGVGGADMVLVRYGPDIYKPVINVNSPIQNQVFGTTAPDFNFSIIEPNLNYTWYTIDNGATNVTFMGLTGTINQTEWDKKGHGTVIILIYANDSLGNSGSKSVIIWKDLVKPNITINSPTLNNLCGVIAPQFSLTIDEPNLHKKWYSLNGGENLTFSTENQINQEEWNKCSNGTVLIRFYANDTAGNLNYSEVTVRKDGYDPIITIRSPINNQLFGKNPPFYNISIEEVTSVSCWYILEGVTGLFPFNILNGTIDQEGWQQASEGEVMITFYAIDEAGNVGSNSVFVIKELKEENAIMGYNLFILWVFTLIMVYFIKKKLKKRNF